MKQLKYIFLALFLISFTASCKTKAPTKTPDVVITDGNNGNNNQGTAHNTNNTIEEEDNEEADSAIVVIPIDTLVEPTSLKKPIYKVAVVLPFMNDSLRSSWSNNKNTNFDRMEISTESELSASFMEGMIMALEEMKFDSRFAISAFDNRNSDETNATILENIKKDSFDIIIGPLKKTHVMAFTEYTAEKGLIHISPFSPSKSASKGNTHYYMAEPSLEQHILNMVEYAIDSVKNPHIVFMYNSKGNGTSYAKLVESYLANYNKNAAATKQVSSKIVPYDIDGRSLDSYLQSGKGNVAIIYSFDEGFIHSFVRQGANSRAIVFGMPGWDNSEVISLEHLSKYNFHFTRSWWINEDNNLVSAFEKNYTTKFKKLPTSNAFLGYDIAAIFFNMIDQNGLNFNEKLAQNNYKGISRVYEFKPVIDPNGNVNRVENTNVHIYKIEDFERILVK